MSAGPRDPKVIGTRLRLVEKTLLGDVHASLRLGVLEPTQWCWSQSFMVWFNSSSVGNEFGRLLCWTSENPSDLCGSKKWTVRVSRELAAGNKQETHQIHIPCHLAKKEQWQRWKAKIGVSSQSSGTWNSLSAVLRSYPTMPARLVHRNVQWSKMLISGPSLTTKSSSIGVLRSHPKSLISFDIDPYQETETASFSSCWNIPPNACDISKWYLNPESINLYQYEIFTP